MRVLVVEDERKVARFLERGLKEERFSVDVSNDGEDGLFRAQSNPYDLVVLDVCCRRKTVSRCCATCARAAAALAS